MSSRRDDAPAVVPLPGRRDVLVDRDLARDTVLLLSHTVRVLNDRGIPVPDGTWEIIRAWRTDQPPASPVSATGHECREPGGHPGPSSASSWLTTRQVAQKLGVNPRTVQRDCEEGRQPGAIRVGGRWLIPADDLTAARGATR